MTCAPGPARALDPAMPEPTSSPSRTSRTRHPARDTPHPDSLADSELCQPRFFERAVLEREVGDSLLQGAGFLAQRLDLVRRGGPGGVAGEPLLPGFQELLRPAVVHGRGDALAPAQLGDAVLAPQALEHDADLLLGREVAPRGAPDVFDDGL